MFNSVYIVLIGNCFVSTIILIIIVVIILMLYHLCCTARSQRKTNENENALFFINSTTFALLFFLISIISILLLFIASILMSLNVIPTVIYKYYQLSLPIMEYIITGFHLFGQICMLLVFAARIDYSFRNSMFGYSETVTRGFYSTLFVFGLFAIAIIIILIVFQQTHHHHIIIIAQFSWEIAVQSMSIACLFLFVRKLYQLFTMTLYCKFNRTARYSASHKSQSGASKLDGIDVFDGLSPTIVRSQSMSRRGSTPNLMTPTRSNRSHSSNPFIKRTKSSTKHSYNSTRSFHKASSAPHLSATSTPPPNQTKTGHNRDQTASLTVNHSYSASLDHHNDGSLELIELMTKMTLLVVFAVITSVVCVTVVGIIQFFLPKIYESIYIHLFQIVDMLTTSIMLYLQFEFSSNIYFKLCNKCDFCCLSLCLCFVKYQWKKKQRMIEMASHQPVNSMSKPRHSLKNSNNSSCGEEVSRSELDGFMFKVSSSTMSHTNNNNQISPECETLKLKISESKTNTVTNTITNTSKSAIFAGRISSSLPSMSAGLEKNSPLPPTTPNLDSILVEDDVLIEADEEDLELEEEENLKSNEDDDETVEIDIV